MAKQETKKEGWWMPYKSNRYHYFVDGRSLCNSWIFPNYNDMTPDTGNVEPQKTDCKQCFKKLLKRRKKVKGWNDNKRL